MPKKKPYKPRKDDGWNEAADKEHRRIIKEKENIVKERYKDGWDSTKRKWKEGFNH